MNNEHMTNEPNNKKSKAQKINKPNTKEVIDTMEANAPITKKAQGSNKVKECNKLKVAMTKEAKTNEVNEPKTKQVRESKLKEAKTKELKQPIAMIQE